MTEQNGERTRVMPSRDALHVLEVFAENAKVAFDRILAARALGEAERAIPGDDWQAWARRLIEVGESLHLRVRSLESTLDEALTFVRQGTPIATCTPDENGDFEWTTVVAVRGRRVLVHSGDVAVADRWMSKRRLASLLHLKGRDAQCRWVIGQAALGCEPSVVHDAISGHKVHLSPFARLMGLLRPEKHDLWVILVFSIVVGVLALASPVAVEALVNTVAFGRYLQPVVVLAIMLFTFLAFAAAMRALLTLIVEILQRRLFIRVVEDLAYRLPRVHQNAFDQQYGPELTNRFFDIVTVQKVITSLLLDGISIVLQTIIGMAVLAFYHPFLLGFDVVLLCLIAFITFGLGRGAVKSAVKESKAKYAVAAWLEELTRHPTAFKLHAGNQFALDRADQLAVNWLKARRTHFRIVMRQILFSLGLQAVAATALLGLGGWLVIERELTLGQLVAAELIVVMIVGSFAKMGKHLESFYDLLASVDKLGHLFDLPVETHDKLFHLREGVPATVSVHDVTCKAGSHTVLRGVSMDLQPGESVALVGGAGAGKSMLIEVLCGMREPDTGHVELDGIDLRELRPDSIREHLAVSRTVEVFQGSIDENVHLNRPYISALDVREALATVGLLNELLDLPDGLNTNLQTNGAPLSSSQAARLMLARAIVGRPRLLMIDGTLDALSDQAAGEILTSLTREDTPWTLLVASGRQVVIRACERQVRLPSPPSNGAGKPADWNDSKDSADQTR